MVAIPSPSPSPRPPEGVDAPHELLGLPADERDPIRIVEAAARRLRGLSAAAGGDAEVRRVLAALIRTARDAMLEIAIRRA